MRKPGGQSEWPPGIRCHLMWMVTCCECDKLPLLPVTVKVKVPIGVCGGFWVRMLNPDVPEPVTGVGTNPMREPWNRPVTSKLTVPLNPSTAVIAMSHNMPVPLFLTEKVGVTDIVKSGEATMVAGGAGVACPNMAGAVNASVKTKSVNAALSLV
jgi:hypothetical protein